MFDRVKIKDVKTELGLLVRTHRKRVRYSQEDLANDLNLSRLTIQHVEAGKNYNLDTLLLILNHFDLLSAFFQLIGDLRTNAEGRKNLY